MAKVVATIDKKRDPKRPLAYVDKQGNVKHFKSRQKKRLHKTLAKGVVGKEALKKRKNLKTVLYVKGKKVYETKSGLGKRRRGRKKVRRKASGRRKKTSVRRRRKLLRKSRRCPAVRKKGRVSKRAAYYCLARRKPGRPSKADRAVYRRAYKALGGKKRALRLVKNKTLKLAKSGTKRRRRRKAR